MIIFDTVTNTGHAPRERVSWNINFGWPIFTIPLVTLHVSVWVEIPASDSRQKTIVSRSTWACELKCQRFVLTIWKSWSRSTWACELKLFLYTVLLNCPLVTLHVSVWVEIDVLDISLYDSRCHAPRERVSWNFDVDGTDVWLTVTLHVSVWVEISILASQFLQFQSRSTWACELKLSISLRT